MSDDDNNKVTEIKAAPKLHENRAKMLTLLTELVVEVAEGRVLGLAVATYDGARAYRIRHRGDQDAIILAGEVEALKAAIFAQNTRSVP